MPPGLRRNNIAAGIRLALIIGSLPPPPPPPFTWVSPGLKRGGGRGTTPLLWPAQSPRFGENTHENHTPHNLVCPPLFFIIIRRPPRSPLFPYTPLFRSRVAVAARAAREQHRGGHSAGHNDGTVTPAAPQLRPWVSRVNQMVSGAGHDAMIMASRMP